MFVGLRDVECFGGFGDFGMGRCLGHWGFRVLGWRPNIYSSGPAHCTEVLELEDIARLVINLTRHVRD